MFFNSSQSTSQTFHDFNIESITGENIDLSLYKDKVVLLVNTASKCGFTKQYKGLQTLHERYSEAGLSVIAFPCNQFGAQEPLDSQQNLEFCEHNFGVTFRVNQKIQVNGENTHEIFDWLKTEAPGMLGNQSIKWNFTKFLVNREGQVVDRFAPVTKPLKIEKKIKDLLSKNDTSN